MAFNPASISGGSGGITDGDTGGALSKGNSANLGIVFGKSFNTPNSQPGIAHELRNNHIVHVFTGGLIVAGFFWLKSKKVF